MFTIKIEFLNKFGSFKQLNAQINQFRLHFSNISVSNIGNTDTPIYRGIKFHKQTPFYLHPRNHNSRTKL